MSEYIASGGAAMPEPLRLYLTTAMWTDTPDGYEGRVWGDLDRFPRRCWPAIQAELSEFLLRVEAAGLTDELRTNWPHDLWLTRNHHGCGFWDRGYEETVGDRLTDIAHDMGERYLYAHKGRLFIDGGQMFVCSMLAELRGVSE